MGSRKSNVGLQIATELKTWSKVIK